MDGMLTSFLSCDWVGMKVYLFTLEGPKEPLQVEVCKIPSSLPTSVPHKGVSNRILASCVRKS